MLNVCFLAEGLWGQKERGKRSGDMDSSINRLERKEEIGWEVEVGGFPLGKADFRWETSVLGRGSC